MKPIRLAHVVSHPIQYFAPLYRELARRPEVDLTVQFYSDAGARPFADAEFGRTIAWDASILHGYAHRFASDAASTRAAPKSARVSLDVVQAVAQGGYDAVWAHGTAHATTWAAIAAARARGMRVLIRDEQTLLHRRSGPRALAREAGLRALFSQAHGLYIGEQNRRHFQRYGMPDERLHFAPYVVDNDWFRERATELAPHRAALRARFGVDDDAPVVLFAGKLVAKKQPLRLIEALTRLRTPARLLIAGDGALRHDAESLAARLGIGERVRFAGFLSQDELCEAYTAADVFVLPSQLRETWGLVVNEAMNFGLPVVVSDMVGCGADLVGSGRNGEIVAHDDTAALAEAIERLVASPALRAAYGACARERVARYSIVAAAVGIIEGVIAATDRASRRVVVAA